MQIRQPTTLSSLRSASSPCPAMRWGEATDPEASIYWQPGQERTCYPNAHRYARTIRPDAAASQRRKFNTSQQTESECEPKNKHHIEKPRPSSRTALTAKVHGPPRTPVMRGGAEIVQLQHHATGVRHLHEVMKLLNNLPARNRKIPSGGDRETETQKLPKPAVWRLPKISLSPPSHRSGPWQSGWRSRSLAPHRLW